MKPLKISKKVRIIRHGEKHEQLSPDKDGLTEMGRIMSWRYGRDLRDEELSRIYCSPYARAYDTAMEIREGYEKFLAITKSKTLCNDKRFSSSRQDRHHSIYLRFGEGEVIKSIVATGKSRDPDDIHSSCARDIGRAVLGLINRLEPGSFVLVSHSGVIECAEAVLKDCYDLQALGGPIPYLQGFVLVFCDDGNLRVFFREQEASMMIINESDWAEMSK